MLPQLKTHRGFQSQSIKNCLHFEKKTNEYGFWEWHRVVQKFGKIFEFEFVPKRQLIEKNSEYLKDIFVEKYGKI